MRIGSGQEKRISANMTQTDVTTPPPAAQVSHADIKAIVRGVVLAMFLGALDQTIVATALPTIGRELGDFEHMSWVASIYMLAATAVTPLYGKLSDIHGRRVVLLTGITTFIIGSVACALAPTMWMLIAARALQGIGGGGLISLGQTIVADVVAPRERGRYQVYFASVFMSASVLGPVLGGLFSEHLHWTMIFWINIPLGCLAFMISRSALRRLPRHDRKHSLDVLGALLMTGATITLMLALTYSAESGGWRAPLVWWLSGLSLMLWCLFAWRMNVAAEPLIPVDVLGNQVVRTGVLASCFGMGTYIGLTIYMPVYFEVVLHMSAEQSGLALIPLMVGTVVGATVSGRVMLYFTHYKRLPIAGLSMAIAAVTFMAFGASSLSFVLMEVVLALISLGMGTVLPITTVTVQNAVAPHQLGTATGSMNFFRNLGSALIISIFSALLLGGEGQIKGRALEAVVQAEDFKAMFLAAALGFGLSLLFISLQQERPLRGKSPQKAGR